jgi:hypothetical protein
MSNSILVGYSPNDFFYADAETQGIMPTEEKCASMQIYSDTWNTTCNDMNFEGIYDASTTPKTLNSDMCISKELCKNKDYVNKLFQVEKKHSGSNEKYYNVKEKYDATFMDTINLAIGCVFLVVAIVKNR